MALDSFDFLVAYESGGWLKGGGGLTVKTTLFD